MKKIYIIAGEKSGDKIGSLIIKELKSQLHLSVIKGVGGCLMEEEGLSSLFPMEQISLMGFAEIIPHIFRLNNLINQTVKDAREFEPDIIITIDSPGFSTRVVSKLRTSLKAKFVHVVAPTVWAYKPERAAKFAALYDLMLTLLPFEPPYFEKEGLRSIFVGHFIHEQKICMDPSIFRSKYSINSSEKLLCILPGSREGEVKIHMPIFVETIKILQHTMDLKIAILASNSKIKAIISSYIIHNNLNNIIICENEASELYRASDIALAKSGTNNLEISLHNTPLVICYKVNFLTWLYIKFKISIKFANLVNIIWDKMVIPEFIQHNCTALKLANALMGLIKDEDKSKMQTKNAIWAIDQMKNSSGSPSKIAVREILS